MIKRFLSRKTILKLFNPKIEVGIYYVFVSKDINKETIRELLNKEDYHNIVADRDSVSFNKGKFRFTISVNDGSINIDGKCKTDYRRLQDDVFDLNSEIWNLLRLMALEFELKPVYDFVYCRRQKRFVIGNKYSFGSIELLKDLISW